MILKRQHCDGNRPWSSEPREDDAIMEQLGELSNCPTTADQTFDFKTLLSRNCLTRCLGLGLPSRRGIAVARGTTYVAALRHLKEGAAIINTTSVTAYKGNPQLIDYSATKGAIVAFTRALSNSLVEKGIRVNGVAPGPIWTPLIPSTFPPEKVASFGANVPMKRAGQPEEVAPSYVFLASDDSSYISGQILHPNGGEVVNG
jgi:NAD(P)-dependent dehydrogenase (short-subunit alcohol dehydrogenase family)